MKKSPDTFTGPSAYEKAKNMARQGHTDWIIYKDRAGQMIATRLTSKAVLAALLAVGTQGRFTEIQASTGHSMVYRWRSGINRLAHARYFEKHGPLF